MFHPRRTVAFTQLCFVQDFGQTFGFDETVSAQVRLSSSHRLR